MTIRVGIIGTGLIGEDHGRKLVNAINGSTVSAVSDINLARARDVAQVLGGAPVFHDGHDLIRSPEVDAVLVTSTGPTHAEFVLSCIGAGKPVMCEKPLAPTAPECEEILKAEVAFGRRLVIAGYMRRYDPGYRAVKGALESGAIGDALVLHNVHRNATVGEAYTSFMTMTDSMIHEVDTTRWLLGEEITSVQVIPPKRTPTAYPHLQDPQFAAFTTESGVLLTVEFFANCQYGYDVRCELVGSIGTASMVNPTVASTLAARTLAERIPADWRERFGAAYTAELQAWISGLEHGECVGPSAWEGYAATKVVEVGVEAVKSGRRMKIDYIEKPSLYRQEEEPPRSRLASDGEPPWGSRPTRSASGRHRCCSQPGPTTGRMRPTRTRARPGAAASRQGSVWPETSGRPSAGVLRVGDPQRASGLLVSRQGSEGAAPRGITPVQPSTKGTFPAGLMPGLPR